MRSHVFVHNRWWPEVPVIISIAALTVIMGAVCLDVYKKEKASAGYTGGRRRLTMKVFKQACWFVSAFYFTWVPYLMLQVRHGCCTALYCET